MIRWITVIIVLLAIVVAGLVWWNAREHPNDAATTQAVGRVQQGLHEAGQGIEEAATAAGAVVKPALHNAGKDIQSMVHHAAENVATRTATQPATQETPAGN